MSTTDRPRIDGAAPEVAAHTSGHPKPAQSHTGPIRHCPECLRHARTDTIPRHTDRHLPHTRIPSVRILRTLRTRGELMTEPRFKVGDPVTVSGGRYRSSYETTIVRIGRKYAYIERYSREIGFDLFTGYEANNKYGAPSRIRTAEMVAEDERRRNVILALKEHGITYERGDFQQSTDVLEQILRVIEETA